MERRLSLLAAPFALALSLVFTACGDDDDGPADGGTGGDGTAASATVSEADARRTEVAGGLEQPTVADVPLPSPTAVPDDAPVVQVVSGATVFAPTSAEFAGLATAEITAGGKTYTGVTLEALAAAVEARPEAIANIEGTRADNLRFGALRFPLPEVGSTTVVVAGEGGHLSLASSSIPEGQWLRDLTGISFE